MKLRRRFLTTGLSALALSAGPNVRAKERDWPLASPESQGVDGVALNAVLDDAAARTQYALNGLVVVRNGQLIGERSYNYPPSALFPINSVTKSVSSILIGIALEQGKIKSLDQTVGALLPEAAAKAPGSAANRVKLSQILTQTSGLEDVETYKLSLSPDPIAGVQVQPVHLADPPIWGYCNAAVSLISPILAHAVGGPLEDYAQQVLLDPLGIESFGWDRDATRRPMSWAGLKLRPRDVVKFAWLMADGGRWLGTQVVPERWVGESLKSHVVPSSRVPPMKVDGYGYLWFTGTISDRRAFWGWGYGSQFALLVPSMRLAVATAATAPSSAATRKQNELVMSVVADIVNLAR